MSGAESALTLEEYAAVHAGQSSGYDLVEVLHDQSIASTVWDAGEAPWRDAIAADMVGEGALGAQYDRCLRRAYARYARRVEPLENDLEAWLSFFGKWSTHPRQHTILARVGLQAMDVLRLHEHWSSRFDEDADLREKRDALLLDPPAQGAEAHPLPEVTTHPATLVERLVRVPGLTLASMPALTSAPQREQDDDHHEDAELDAEMLALAPPPARAVDLVTANPQPGNPQPGNPQPANPQPPEPAASIIPEPPATAPITERTPDATPVPAPSTAVPTFLRASRIGAQRNAVPASVAQVTPRQADLEKTSPPGGGPKPALPFRQGPLEPPPPNTPRLGSPDAGGTSTLMFTLDELSVGKATPFEKASEPTTATADLRATFIGAVPSGPALPFLDASDDAESDVDTDTMSVPTPPATQPSHGRTAKGATVAALPEPAGPTIPFSSDETVFGLTLPQYASLCVEVAREPSAKAEIFGRYNLDMADNDALHNSLESAMDARPRLRTKWADAVSTYRKWYDREKAGSQ